MRDHFTASEEVVSRADRTIKDLKLEARYQYHKQEVLDLFQRARFYHKGKIEEIEELVETANLRRQLFADATSEINTVPLAKLKKDILDLVVPKQL